MLAPVRTVAPETDPVTWPEADVHLRLDGDTTEQAFVESLIAAAAAHLDGWSGVLGRALVTQSWRQDFAGFGCLRLPLAPVSSITSVTYYDGDNAQQTLATSVYQLLTDARGPLVDLKPDQDWPATYTRPEAVSVTYVAGYGAAADVPAAIRAAILLLVGHWYENREASVVGVSVAELPLAVDRLLNPYRRIGL
jgi:uncharacterized phiE125 gp8 family phage protein